MFRALASRCLMWHVESAHAVPKNCRVQIRARIRTCSRNAIRVSGTSRRLGLRGHDWLGEKWFRGRQHMLQPTKRNSPFVAGSAVKPDLGSKLGKIRATNPGSAFATPLAPCSWGPHVGASSASKSLPDKCKPLETLVAMSATSVTRPLSIGPTTCFWHVQGFKRWKASMQILPLPSSAKKVQHAT